MIIKCVKVGNYLIDIDKTELFIPSDNCELIDFGPGVIIYDGAISLKETSKASTNIYSYIVSIRCQKIKDNLENLMKYADLLYLHPPKIHNVICNEDEEKSLYSVQDFDNKHLYADNYVECILKATDSIIWLLSRDHKYTYQEVDLDLLFQEIGQMLAVRIICESKYTLNCDYNILKSSIIDIILFCKIKDIYINSEELDQFIESAAAKIAINLFGDFSIKDIAAIALCCYSLEETDLFVEISEKNIRIAALI